MRGLCMSCEKGGEGGQNLPSHTGFQTDFLKPVWTCGTGGSLCPAPFLLFNLLVWFSQKRERETPETLWDSPACVETARGSQGVMVLCHHPL